MVRMTQEEKRELLVKIKAERDQNTGWREIGPKFGQKASWAAVFWNRNKALLDTPPPAPPTRTTAPIMADPTPETPPPTRPPRRPPTPPPEPTLPSYGKFIAWCRDHPEHPNTAAMIKNCEGGPKKHWRSIIMQCLDLLAAMQESP